MNKVLLTTFALSGLLFASLSPAFADTYTPNSVTTGSHFRTIHPLYTSPPTQYWNLNGNPYRGSFTDVTDGGFTGTGIFTNDYFSPNGYGQLSLSSNVTGNQTASQKYDVYLFERTSGLEVSGLQYAVDQGNQVRTYYNLNVNDFYYFEFKAVGTGYSINGNFVVSH